LQDCQAKRRSGDGPVAEKELFRKRKGGASSAKQRETSTEKKKNADLFLLRGKRKLESLRKKKRLESIAERSPGGGKNVGGEGGGGARRVLCYKADVKEQGGRGPSEILSQIRAQKSKKKKRRDGQQRPEKKKVPVPKHYERRPTKKKGGMGVSLPQRKKKYNLRARFP